MSPTSAESLIVQGESPLLALTLFASSCISEEVRYYFSDAISHHYFDRISNKGITEDTPGAFARGELDINGEGKGYIFYRNLTMKNLFPFKSTRKTIVDRLQEDTQSFGNNGLKSRVKCERSENKKLDDASIADALSRGCCGYLYSASYNGPAHTTVLSCTPCRVLKGYYMIWAETQLRVTIYRQPMMLVIDGRDSLSDADDPPTAPHILPLLLSQIRSQGLRWCRHGKLKPPSAGVLVSSVRSPLSPCPGRRGSFPLGIHHATTLLTSQSLHFVHLDALQARRREAFALQSILHPRRGTLLECYPKQMIHFGLTAYALWNAREGGWGPASALAGPCHSAVAPSSPSDSRTRQKVGPRQQGMLHFTGGEGDEDLLPMRDSDAILVLGLGGNVLGQCLDTLLSPVVKLHVVEVEPVVLEACVAYDQLPPLQPAVSPALRYEDKFKANPTSTNPDIAPLKKKPDEFFASEPHPRGPRYRIYLQDIFNFLKPKKSQNADSSSVDYYNMIFLDCYDPNSETMIHSRELLELCHQRLRPGGVVVINAHFLPKSEVLKKQFLGYGFASVQALRVAGLNQSIILCLRGPDFFPTRDKASSSISQYTAFLTQRGLRFTLRNARAIAEYINQRQLLCRGEGHHREESLKTNPSHMSASSTLFALNPMWLKSCRLLMKSRSKQGSLITVRENNPENDSSDCDISINLKRVCLETESCRIWEHFS
ncbi:unnamed protein product [Phytomonas sp. Hart1]|nr:unnamed protein product [Phytomonas sp. Hart1]|eukprot:CCW68653.1 unnamed protein product [Phytomonas sp. isolate Hart1]